MSLSPYQKRIADIRNRIQHHSGDDSRLRNRLQGVQQQHQQSQGGGGGGAPGQQPPQAPLPWDSQYETQMGQLGRDRDFALSQNQFNQGQLSSDYGFGNSSDPFSVARNLQYQWEVTNRGTQNSMAAQGQLYSGANQDLYAYNRRNYDQSVDAAQKEYQAQLRDLIAQRYDIQSQYNQGAIGAKADQLASAMQERVDPAEAPPNRNRPNQRRRRGRGR